MEKIVIAGGGFAGISAGLYLKKRLSKAGTKLIFIDRNPFHLFTPSLYEIATSEEPQKNIAIPIAEIFGDSIELIISEITKIDIRAQNIKLKNGKDILYDYLIISLGSEPAFYNINGLAQYSFPLKTVTDAVKIKDSMHKLCDLSAAKGKETHIVIGGGGFSGTELAAELSGYVQKLAKEHKISPKLFNVCIIQGSEKLLKELDNHVSDIAEKRLSKMGVEMVFGDHIREVSANKLTTKKGKEFSFDILIWTGGVRANGVVADSGLPLNSSGQIIVNQYLQVNGPENIFAIGDIAEFIDPILRKSAPGVAQVAEDEGKIAAENVIRLIEKKPLVPYKYKHFGYIVPLKGRYAVYEEGWLHADGFFAWVLQQIVFLRYLLGILPFHKAFKRWNQFEKDLRQE